MEGSFIIIPCTGCGTKNRIPKNRTNSKASCGKCHKPLVFQSGEDHPVDVGDSNFRAEVLEFPGAALVVFWVPWCGACKMVLPSLEILAHKYAGRIKIIRVNVEQNPLISSYYKIDSTPTLHLYKNGSLLKTFVGAVPQGELEEHIKYVLS
jgi:thioredoxin 2